MMHPAGTAEHAAGTVPAEQVERLLHLGTQESAARTPRTLLQDVGAMAVGSALPHVVPTRDLGRSRGTIASVPMTREVRGQGSRPRGRRRERRTVKKLVSYTPEEFRAVVTGAAACGRTPARFIREVSLGAVPQARRNETADEMIRHLARIGNALNQLAREAHVSGQLVAEERLEAVLATVNNAIDRIG